MTTNTGNFVNVEAGSQAVGEVMIIHGTVKAMASDGTERLLAPNSPVFANERIMTGSDGMVSIMFTASQSQLDLGRMSEVTLDEDIYAGEAPIDLSDAAAEAQEIQEALMAEDFDPTAELEAPAAGAGGLASAGGGHSRSGGVGRARRYRRRQSGARRTAAA